MVDDYQAIVWGQGTSRPMTGAEATELVLLHLEASAESSVKVASVYIEEAKTLGPRALEVRFSDGTTAVVTVNVEDSTQ